MTKRRLLHIALFAGVFLLAFSHALTPERSSNDVWWHLRTGQYIVENGYKLPRIDPFNWRANAQGIEWHNHEWLGQILMWWAYRAGEELGRPFGWDGMHGLILAKALLVGAAFLVAALLAAWMAGAGLPGALAGILGVAVGRFTMYPRPPVYTYLLLMLLYALLHAARSGRIPKRLLWLVFPFFALWVNLHGGWAAGGVLLAAFAAGAFFDSLGRHYRTTYLVDLPRALAADTVPWIRAGVLALLGTLCNPSGFNLYAIFSRVMSDQQLVGAIGEMAPPDARFVAPFFVSILLFLVLGLAVRRPFPFAAEYLFLPFFLWQSIHHVRHLTLWGLLMIPALAWLIGEALRQLPRGIAGAARAGLVALFVLLWCFWTFVFSNQGTYHVRNRQFIHGKSFVREGYPAGAAEFLRAASLRGLKGRLFNLDSYAGYLIWKLSPEPYRVFSDSRFDIFGGDIQREANELITAPPGWDARLQRMGVNIAVLPWDKMLTVAMVEDPNWIPIYWDAREGDVWKFATQPRYSMAGFMVFARAGEANSRELLEELRAQYEASRRVYQWPRFEDMMWGDDLSPIPHEPRVSAETPRRNELKPERP